MKCDGYDDGCAEMIRAVRAVVHDGVSVEEAFGIFEGTRGKPLRPVAR